jgi:hypothetical protein
MLSTDLELTEKRAGGVSREKMRTQTLMRGRLEFLRFRGGRQTDGT